MGDRFFPRLFCERDVCVWVFLFVSRLILPADLAWSFALRLGPIELDFGLDSVRFD